MKRTALIVLPAQLALTSLAFGQAATPKAATSTPARKPATNTAAGPKLPPNVPVVHGIVKTAFALRYEDYKVGTGKLAEPGKLYKVHYTGWLAADGKKFDSSYDHKRPVLDKDNKPVKNDDGTPKLGEAEPIQFPQGRRGVIPGWDQGFAGMKVGGKRRLFIPYQLAYGDLGRAPVIPPKSDLIFDIELLDVTDMPAAPQRPPMPMRPGGAPGAMPGAPGSRPGATPGTPAPPAGQPATQPTTPPPANPAKPADPTQPTTAPNSSPAPSTPPPPASTSPTAAPDKPANPAQPPTHN